MATAHARRHAGRANRNASHPGQAASAPRKRAAQRARRQGRANHAQILQDQVPCTIVLRNGGAWQKAFAGITVRIDPRHAGVYGGTTLPMIDYLRINSGLNKVSFERAVVSELMTRGYQLEGLEAEFEGPERAAWGRCIWYKEHAKYAEPLPEGFEKSPINLLSAMFQTQYAGDQAYCLFSTQMLGAVLLGRPQILLRKTIVFRRVVLSPPAGMPC